MYGKPADVWALGCTFYQMIYGEFPFGHSSDMTAVGHRILHNE